MLGEILVPYAYFFAIHNSIRNMLVNWGGSRKIYPEGGTLKYNAGVGCCEGVDKPWKFFTIIF